MSPTSQQLQCRAIDVGEKYLHKIQTLSSSSNFFCPSVPPIIAPAWIVSYLVTTFDDSGAVFEPWNIGIDTISARAREIKPISKVTVLKKKEKKKGRDVKRIWEDFGEEKEDDQNL